MPKQLTTYHRKVVLRSSIWSCLLYLSCLLSPLCCFCPFCWLLFPFELWVYHINLLFLFFLTFYIPSIPSLKMFYHLSFRYNLLVICSLSIFMLSSPLSLTACKILLFEYPAITWHLTELITASRHSQFLLFIKW